MRKEDISSAVHGFSGTYFPTDEPSSRAMISLMGLSGSMADFIAKGTAAWLNGFGINALQLKIEGNGLCSFPLETFRCIFNFLQSRGCTKIGVIGMSTGGMMALAAASHFQEISLTIALTPSDFVMEGFIHDGKDGCRERPAGASSLSYEGKPLPYLPYALRHPDYWNNMVAEAKEGGNILASRAMFDKSEELHPLEEDEFIPVENIAGKLFLIGAEDDALWDTARYIKRMKSRLAASGKDADAGILIYEHGTHAVLPQSLVRKILPAGSSLFLKMAFRQERKHHRECLKARKEIDESLSEYLKTW